MSMNDQILDEARRMEGAWEWAGEDHNPEVLAMYADAGHPEIRKDEVPWCAAYVGAVLARCGLQNTGSLLAKSYTSWGRRVKSLDDARPGDIVVFDRGSKSWQGHVGFYIGHSGKKIQVLGGNQGDQVNVSEYPSTDLVAIRRVKAPKQSLAESSTVNASVTGAVSAAATGAMSVSKLDGNAQIIVIVGGVVVILAFAWIFRERVKKFVAGVR